MIRSCKLGCSAFSAESKGRHIRCTSKHLTCSMGTASSRRPAEDRAQQVNVRCVCGTLPLGRITGSHTHLLSFQERCVFCRIARGEEANKILHEVLDTIPSPPVTSCHDMHGGQQQGCKVFDRRLPCPAGRQAGGFQGHQSGSTGAPSGHQPCPHPQPPRPAAHPGGHPARCAAPVPPTPAPGQVQC